MYEVGKQFVDKFIRDWDTFIVLLRNFVVFNDIKVAWFTDEVSVSFNESLLISFEMGLTIPERCNVASFASTFEIERRFWTVIL